MGGRRAQIDFATVGCIIVTIRKTHGTGQTAHTVGARRRRIRPAWTCIAAHTAIVDVSDVDLATVGRHHVAIGKTRRARFDGAFLRYACRIGMRQIARVFAESTVLRGFNRRFTAVGGVAVAIGRARTAWIVFACSARTRLKCIALVAAYSAIVGIRVENRFTPVDRVGVAIRKTCIALADAACTGLALAHGVGSGADRIARPAIVAIGRRARLAAIRRISVAIAESRGTRIKRAALCRAFRDGIRNGAWLASHPATELRVVRLHARAVALSLARSTTPLARLRFELIEILGAVCNANNGQTDR